MLGWESKMREANQAFGKNDYGQAIALYRNALGEARLRFPALINENADQAFASVMVCYYNLAEAHWLESNSIMAAHQFVECFQFLESQLYQLCERSACVSACVSAFEKAFKKTVIEFSCLRQRLECAELSAQTHCLEEIELIMKTIKARHFQCQDFRVARLKHTRRVICL